MYLSLSYILPNNGLYSLSWGFSRAVNPSALRHRCRDLRMALSTRPFIRDASSNLLCNLRVGRVSETGAAGTMPPLTADVALESVLFSPDFSYAFSAAILRNW